MSKITTHAGQLDITGRRGIEYRAGDLVEWSGERGRVIQILSKKQDYLELRREEDGSLAVVDLAQVRRIQRKLPSDRTLAIEAALRTGISYGTVADVMGISRQRVGQIARRMGWVPTTQIATRDQSGHGTDYAFKYLRCRCAACQNRKGDDNVRPTTAD